MGATMRTRYVSTAVLVGVASTVAIALAGCAGTQPKVATAASAPASANQQTSGTSADDVTTYVAAVREWVKCMRNEGIDLSDPDSTGQVTFADSSGLTKTDPKNMAAQNKCKAALPAVPESVDKLRRPKLSPEQIDLRRQYATCMQNHGAPDFPDPGADGFPSRDKKWDSTSLGAQQATRACAPIIGAPATPGPGVG